MSASARPDVARIAAAGLAPFVAGTFAQFLLPGSGAPVAIGVLGSLLVYWLSRRLAWLDERLSSVREEVLAATEDAVAMPALLALTGGHLGHSSWALSPAALLRVLNLLDMHRHRVVVECGSGVSTVVLAEYFRRRGEGHVYAVEHDEAWASHVRRRLSEHALEAWATVVHAPLEPLDDGTGRKWYRATAVEPVRELPRIDVLLVDGPPKWAGVTSRGRALEVFGERVAPGGSVVLDDARRPGERQVAAEWRRQTGWDLSEWRTSHGQIVLTRNSTTLHIPATL